MTVLRWKVMAGVLGLSVGGLAALSGQATKPEDAKKSLPDLPPAARVTPAVPTAPPIEVGPPSLPAPAPDVLALPAPGPVPMTAPKLPPVPPPAPVATTPPRPTGLDTPVLVVPDLPKPSTPPVASIPPSPPRAGLVPTPPAPNLPAPVPTPAPAILEPPVASKVAPPPAPQPMADPFKSAPVAGTSPGVVTAGPAIPLTPAVPVAGMNPPQPDIAPTVPTTPRPGLTGAGAELSVTPTVTSTPVSLQTKFRIILRVGEGEPMFEVRHGDDLVMKVTCEKVDVKSPERGQGLSAVSATGKVRFVGFGAVGTCESLSFLAGTGEVLMAGKVMIQVKDKLGRVESELSTESIKYRVDASAMPGTLKP